MTLGPDRPSRDQCERLKRRSISSVVTKRDDPQASEKELEAEAMVNTLDTREEGVRAARTEPNRPSGEEESGQDEAQPDSDPSHHPPVASSNPWCAHACFDSRS